MDIATQIAMTKDIAVPVHIGNQAIYRKNKDQIKAVTGIPTFAYFGAAIAIIRTNAKIKMKDMIIPACDAVTPMEGAIDVNQSSQTIRIEYKKRVGVLKFHINFICQRIPKPKNIMKSSLIHVAVSAPKATPATGAPNNITIPTPKTSNFQLNLFNGP